MENQNNEPKVAGLYLFVLGLLSETCRNIVHNIAHNIIDNYDTYFKVLTIGILISSFITYTSKFIYNATKFIISLFKKKDNETDTKEL